MISEKDTELYKKELFEIHTWKMPKLPFIYHKDIVNNGRYCYGNWHDSLELLLVTEGQGCILCNSKNLSISRGDMIIINSGEVHRVYSDSEIKYHCFIVSCDFCVENGFDIKKLKYQNLIRDEKASRLYLLAIDEIKSNLDPFRIPAARAAALSLLVYLNREYSKDADENKENSRSSIIRKGIEYINYKFSEKLTLDEIAGTAGLSKYHFLREFKLYTGYTVTSYINTIRCEYAKHLLINTNFHIGKIAALCGFDNLSYFSKTFKKHTGLSPSQFEKKLNRC